MAVATILAVSEVGLRISNSLNPAFRSAAITSSGSRGVKISAGMFSRSIWTLGRKPNTMRPPGTKTRAPLIQLQGFAKSIPYERLVSCRMSNPATAVFLLYRRGTRLVRRSQHRQTGDGRFLPRLESDQHRRPMLRHGEGEAVLCRPRTRPLKLDLLAPTEVDRERSCSALRCRDSFLRGQASRRSPTAKRAA